MKLLIVTPLLPPESGGPAYYSVALKEALERAGQEVALIAFREVRKYPSGIRHLIFLYKVWRSAKGSDALIILDTVSVALPAVLAGRLRGVRTVIRTGGDFVWEHYVERTKEPVFLSEFYTAPRALSLKEQVLVWLQKSVVFRLVDMLAFSTSWQRDLWLAPYDLNKGKVAVVENSYPSRTSDAQGGDTFLCAWRPTGFKNIPALEKAYTVAKEKCPDLKLEILKDVPREELHNRMRSARALVVPSLSEVSPNMAMEALAIGLPVLLTKDCGTYDRLNGAVTWIDPKDPKALAGALCTLCESEPYQKARDGALRFSFVRTYDDVATDFLALLKKRY